MDFHRKKELKPFLIRFRSTHPEFRFPELQSLVHLFGYGDQFEYDHVQLEIISTQVKEKQSPFLMIKLPSEEAAEKVASRSIAIGAIYEPLSIGMSVEEVVNNIDRFSKEKMNSYSDGTPFKMILESFGRKGQDHLEYFKKFDHLPFWKSCPLSLTEPKRIFAILLDFGRAKDDRLKRAYFARQIQEGAGHLIDRFNVKTRKYIGTTTMDSELSLLLANQALAHPGTLILDPFAGTGSLLIACSHFGAMTIGGDIDPRVLRGNEESTFLSNFEQYNIKDKLVDLVICDQSQLPWRSIPFLDAIVGDPPYGVRAGARRVGKKNKSIRKEIQGKVKQTSKREHDYLPQCVAYNVDEVLKDLLIFAARNLVVGGRLVYWLPTTNLYTESDLPLHPCLKIIANSEQPLTMKWRRRLITMVKFQEYDPILHDNLQDSEYGQINPAHANLREKWLAPNTEKH